MVIVLHGGPGAPHSADGLARGLAARGLDVIAPLQRDHTVAALIDEIEATPDDALVGASWGAMLALAYACAHPVRAIALVGCMPTPAARAAYEERRKTLPNDVDATPPDRTPYDRAQHGAVLADWNRLVADGVYPAAFASITAPVLMLHGELDPRPGEVIRDSLPLAVTYRSFARCGHEPWRERAARDAYFTALVEFLTPAP